MRAPMPKVAGAQQICLRKQGHSPDSKQRELLVASSGRGRGGHHSHRCLLALIARWLSYSRIYRAGSDRRAPKLACVPVLDHASKIIL